MRLKSVEKQMQIVGLVRENCFNDLIISYIFLNVLLYVIGKLVPSLLVLQINGFVFTGQMIF